jgi:hypothetical protein
MCSTYCTYNYAFEPQEEEFSDHEGNISNFIVESSDEGLEESYETDDDGDSMRFLESCSIYFCVYWNTQNKKWRAQVRHKKKMHYIGNFEIEEDAAKAVNSKCKELKINFKNQSVGVLDKETLKKLTGKVKNV